MITREEFQNTIKPGTGMDVKALFVERYDSYVFQGYSECRHQSEVSKPCCYCKGHIRLKDSRGKESTRCVTMDEEMHVKIHAIQGILEDELFEI